MKFPKQALIIAIALLILLSPLPAKERRGADVLIRKIDGAEIRGELIAVKTNALLVLSQEGRDVTVGSEEIDSVKVIMKAHPWRGAGIGLLVGIAAGALYGLTNPGTAEPDSLYPPVFAAVLAIPGAIVGSIASGVIARDITHIIQGDPSRFYEASLNDLRKRARVREVE